MDVYAVIDFLFGVVFGFSFCRFSLAVVGKWKRGELRNTEQEKEGKEVEAGKVIAEMMGGNEMVRSLELLNRGGSRLDSEKIIAYVKCYRDYFNRVN